MGARGDNSGRMEVMLSILQHEQEQLYGPANPPVSEYLIS